MSILKIITYSTSTKKEPFTDWLDDLEIRTQAIILTRLSRITLGNFGDCKFLKNADGVWELRIDNGPGYRVYFGKVKSTVVVLLIGGEKKSQLRDIAKAKRYWLDYKESKDE